MNKIRSYVLLGVLAILLIASFFRFWNLTKYPVHLTMDEVAIGNNAYSILKTGVDEWGVRYPLAFKSVGDYKPPVNVYLTVPSIFVFGLTEYAIRFPVAMIGVLSAIVMIFLARQLGMSLTESLFAGFFIAVSPWHVHFSRAGFEAVSALFFFIAGFSLFLYWMKKRRSYLAILSAASFGLSVWTYHSERVFVPIFVLIILVLHKDKIKLKVKKDRKQLSLFLLTTLLFAIPFIYLTVFTPAIRTRALSTSILRDVSLARNLHEGNYASLAQRIFDNDWYLIYRHWLGKYLNYFDLRFWFWKGMQFTPPGYPDLGLLYVVDLPLVLMGFYALVRSNIKLLKKFVLVLFLLGPIPASFTMNEQHPLRALVWIPFFALITASGFGYLLKIFKRRTKIFYSNFVSTPPNRGGMKRSSEQSCPKGCHIKSLANGGAVYVYMVFLVLNMIYFVDIYTHHFPNYFAEYWQYGYKQSAIFACDHRNEYDKIYISDTFGTKGPLNTGVPPIYVRFYCKYDPMLHLTQGDTFNIHYARPNWEEAVRSTEKALYIAAPWDFPLDEIPKEQVVGGVEYPGGDTAFLYVKNKK
jgi:4-amino-4-deoxy-L-arabinose transferase-like glycosyltransferase